MIFPKTELPVLQNRVFDSREDALNSSKGWIELQEDSLTGIVSNVLFDPSLLTYDENYDNEQSNSDTFKSHLENVYYILEPFIKNKKIIEVGCGKGQFLNFIGGKGYDVYGCDPTYEGNDERIRKEFFSKDLNLKGDVIILRHVLEHIKNPVEFLLQIAEANDHKGLIYIEVPDFNWIVDNDVYFDVFYEHVNYFRQNDFKKIFKNTVTSGIFFSGQYQYVVADLASVQSPPYKIEASFTKTLSFGCLQKTVEQLRDYEGVPIYVWGAASKGVIASIYLIYAGIRLTSIIDINERKQNKFIAITALQVISPNDFNKLDIGAIILVANPNYRAEIVKMVNNQECRFISL